MRRLLTQQWDRRRRRDERGAIAIIVALSMTGLMVVAGMVLDFGLVRIDRQVDKSAADAAAVAGLHALKGGDDKVRPFVAVCAAIRYLRANGDRFAGVTSSAGTWTTGTGSAAGNGCTDATASSKICAKGSPASWARYTWTGTWQGAPLRVEIQGGYALTGTTGWPEDTLPAAAGSSDDRAGGCDQISVVITQHRKPGFGSIATSNDLVSSIRSVGRVQSGPGKYAPAMLLLKRTGCPVLQSGAAGGGSFVHVLGAVTSSGVSQPGTIHSDSDAEGGCTGGSNQNLFLGKGTAGIVAYAAPLVANPLLADPTKPGQISSVGGSNGKGLGYIRDLDANVYSSAALNPAGAGSVARSTPFGRGLVTRQPIDARYLSGVRTAIGQANNVFSTVNASNAQSLGFAKLADCKPTQAALNGLALTATSRLFVDCTSNGGFGGVSADLSINAGTVIFNGAVAPSASLSLPNARAVYVTGNGSADSIVLGGGTASLRMNTNGNLDSAGRCAATRSSNKATLFVQSGDIKESTANNLLQLCRTTVFMMGGQASGCVPTLATRADGTAVGYDPADPLQTVSAPTATPCGGSVGSGQLTQNGGNIDWTAPDQYDVMTLPDGTPDPAKVAAWSDPNGLEDLALWSESGTSSSSTYNMSGGGIFNVRGVFMVPNADPFTIGGGGTMTLGNAQFIASTIALNGNTTNITMAVDPNAAVTMPELMTVGLVR
jgi:Flp pilus assembly protein TadG